jgi:hypothetical protein
METGAGTQDRWVEVWRGGDPAEVGRKLDAAGISMRLAASGGFCGTGGGFSLLSLFRRQPQSRLLVPEADVERARALI